MAQIPNEERKTLILTGASRGIGHATVKRFSSAGWRVITCSRHGFPENCPWEAGPEDHIQVDLADPDNTLEAIAVMKERLKAQGGQAERARQQRGDLAERRGRPQAEQPGDRPSRLDDGVPGEFLRADHARPRPDRGARGGVRRVVNVSSIAGARVHPFAGSAYATSKAALAALTREMAADFAPRGIRVNAISPGRSTRRSCRREPRG